VIAPPHPGISRSPRAHQCPGPKSDPSLASGTPGGVPLAPTPAAPHRPAPIHCQRAASHIPRRSQPLIIVSARANRNKPGAKPCVSDDKWR
jgi:hypothetical protein